MPIAADPFRDALRLFASGVTIVTIRAGEQIHGLTVAAFASVSPDPPLIAALIDRAHRGHALLEAPDAVFAVNVLAEEHRELSERFAHGEPSERFARGRWGSAVTGAPVLEDAIAWLDCRVHARVGAGSHTIFIGEVQASATRPEARPLLYWNRGYRTLG